MKRKIILRSLLIFITFIFYVTYLSSYGSAQQSNGFVPPDGKILLFIGQDQKTIQEYIYSAGVIPGGFMVYTSLKNLEGLTEAAEYGSGIQHAQYFVDGYPHMAVQLGLHMVGILDGVTSGHYDINIVRLAQWIQQTQRPVYLRIGYEFDLPQNRYNPKKYVQAFRYIVDYFRRLEVSNVAFVWHSCAGYAPSRMDWYPGDEYVDWFAVSFFDPYNRGNMDFVATRARERGKPFMIAEATPKGIGVSGGQRAWDKWYERFFQFIDRQNVRAICYINSNWEELPMFKGKKWLNARVQDNDVINRHWLDRMNSGQYLHASEELFFLLK